MLTLRNPRKLLAGIFFLGVAAVHFWQGANLKLGTFAQMGPGMFPLMLELALVLIGAICTFVAFRFDGEKLPALTLREPVAITLAILCFAICLPLLGAVPGLALAVLVASAAIPRSRIIPTVALTVILVTLCVLIFSFGLRVPMRLFIIPGAS